MYKTRLFYDDGNGGGGGTLPLSMADMLNDGNGQQLSATPLDPTKTPEQEALKAEAFDAVGGLNPGYLRDAGGVISKDPDYKPDTGTKENVDEEGNPLPGFKKDDTGKIVEDPDYKEPELSEEQEVEKFYERLHAITGTEVKVEYPEGTDPLSPEGIALYIQQANEQAVLGFENYIRQTDPRSYAYMLHRQGGGDDESFFGDNKGFALPDRASLEGSADTQTMVYKFDLKSRGLDDDTVETLVKKAITENKLKEKAVTAYTKIEEDNRRMLDTADARNRLLEEQTDKAVGVMVTSVNETIARMDFIVAETDKAAFSKFALDSLRYNSIDNSFTIAQQINANDLKQHMESLFYQFKKGDLSKLIIKAAKTQAAQSLRARTGKANTTTGTGKIPSKNSVNHIPLSEIMVSQ